MSDIEDRIARLEAALGLNPEIDATQNNGAFMWEIQRFVRGPLERDLSEIKRQLRTVSPDYFRTLIDDLEEKRDRDAHALFSRFRLPKLHGLPGKTEWFVADQAIIDYFAEKGGCEV